MVYRPIQTILLADDNTDDCELVKEAWAEFPIGERLRLVNDGIELLDYLYRRGEFMTPESSPRPSVILLDLNMPRMTGLEVLAEIKQDSAFAGIPIVVLTTSKAPEGHYPNCRVAGEWVYAKTQCLFWLLADLYQFARTLG